ncbi:hypothetical protein AOQ84DRAFT_85384 [Glonium stellatum]|uniref:Uncharacterized protein n=1 Tax=Glonium stellatum TaxID=574774 RepID=A0A8E2FAW7_9PEZI|nr:hypothetical protein AOQ84DRAFT_85384 [Glonium stellatum]
MAIAPCHHLHIATSTASFREHQASAANLTWELRDKLVSGASQPENNSPGISSTKQVCILQNFSFFFSAPTLTPRPPVTLEPGTSPQTRSSRAQPQNNLPSPTKAALINRAKTQFRDSRLRIPWTRYRTRTTHGGARSSLVNWAERSMTPARGSTLFRHTS